MRGHRQREHALARERRAAAAGRRLQLLVVELDAAAPRSSAGERRPRTASCCSSRSAAGGPRARSSATASAAPGIGSPETWRTPSTSSRMAAMAAESIRVTRSVTLPLREIELRFSRSSGPGGQHAQRSETRVEASSTSRPRRRSRPPRSGGRRTCRAGPARGRPGRAQPVAEPRARGRAARRGGCARRCGWSGRAGRRRPTAAARRAAPRREAPAGRNEAPAPAARRKGCVRTAGCGRASLVSFEP